MNMILPSIGVLMGSLLLFAAACESRKPASHYKAAYARIGSRNDMQMAVWLFAGIGMLLISIDFLATGGTTTKEFFAGLVHRA